MQEEFYWLILLLVFIVIIWSFVGVYARSVTILLYATYNLYFWYCISFIEMKCKPKMEKRLNLITLFYLQFTTKCTPISYFLSKRLLNTFSWNKFISTFENIPFQFSFANHFMHCMKLKREILEVVSIQYLCPEIILHFKSLKFCYRRKNELSHNNMEQFYYSICSEKNKKLDIFYWNVLYYSPYLHICK